MTFPAVKLHHLYSLDFYQNMRILFEDLKIIDIISLENVIKEKTSGTSTPIGVTVSDNFIIDLNNKMIIIKGYKINDTTYMINRKGNGDTMLLRYTCSDKIIWQGIEYLYHMYQNLVPK